MTGGHPLIRSHPFDPATHAVDEFDCGNASLNSWLRQHAAVAARMRTAGTYVWVADGRVVGYYALAPHAVVSAALPSKVRRNAPDPVPAYIIGKLALTLSLHGRGLGSALLLDACARVASVVDVAPGRLVVVDAIDEAAQRFYLARGFREIATNRTTMFMTTNDLIATVAAALNEVTGADQPEP